MNNIEYVLKNFEGHTKEILIENFCPTEFDESFKEICCEKGEEMNCEKCWELKVEQEELEDKEGEE